MDSVAKLGYPLNSPDLPRKYSPVCIDASRKLTRFSFYFSDLVGLFLKVKQMRLQKISGYIISWSNSFAQCKPCTYCSTWLCQIWRKQSWRFFVIPGLRKFSGYRRVSFTCWKKFARVVGRPPSDLCFRAPVEGYQPDDCKVATTKVPLSNVMIRVIQPIKKWLVSHHFMWGYRENRDSCLSATM